MASPLFAFNNLNSIDIIFVETNKSFTSIFNARWQSLPMFQEGCASLVHQRETVTFILPQRFRQPHFPVLFCSTSTILAYLSFSLVKLLMCFANIMICIMQ